MARVIKPAATIVRRGSLEARESAAKIIGAATAEAEQLRAAASARGKREGEALAAATLVRAAGARDQALANVEGEIRDVALEAAARIVEAHVALGGAQIAAITLGALDRARRAKAVRVRLHPDDHAALSALPESPLPAGTTLVADDTLARGDCIVESDLGTVDARVETKLAALRAALESTR